MRESGKTRWRQISCYVMLLERTEADVKSSEVERGCEIAVTRITLTPRQLIQLHYLAVVNIFYMSGATSAVCCSASKPATY